MLSGNVTRLKSIAGGGAETLNASLVILLGTATFSNDELGSKAVLLTAVNAAALLRCADTDAIAVATVTGGKSGKAPINIPLVIMAVVLVMLLATARPAATGSAAGVAPALEFDLVAAVAI